MIGGGEMIEVMDHETSVKLMALILCGIRYDGNLYVVFSIRRHKNDVNLFVSKVIQNSQGLVMDFRFANGEKEVMEKVVMDLINHVSREKLLEQGFVIVDDIQLSGSQVYDIHQCYVSSITLDYLKDMMKYYSFIREDIFEKPVLDVVEEKKVLNDGSFLNILLILFGIFVIIFCVVVVFQVFFKK